MNWDTIFPILIDKLIIGILLLIVGLWIKRSMTKFKAHLDEGIGARVRIAEARLPSYKKLWEITQPVNSKLKQPFNDEEKKELISRLQNWYYDKGQGLFLSEKTRNLYFQARDILQDCDDADEIFNTFSVLRTQLKNEIGIYGEVGYKYQLVQDYVIQTKIKENISTKFIEISEYGLLRIKTGYAWNGFGNESIIDTKTTMRASLVIDALYQLMRDNQLDFSYRKFADNLLYKTLLEDGMSRFRAWYITRSVRMFGAAIAKPRHPSREKTDQIIYRRLKEK